MKVNVYAIYDCKMAVYSQPMFLHNDNTAIRTFTDIVNETQNGLSRHPEDYSLHLVGSWDDNTGKLESFQIMSVINAAAVVRNYQPQANSGSFGASDLVKPSENGHAQ